MSAASLVLGSAIALGGGPALADPPQHAYDNHHRATEGNHNDDNSRLDDGYEAPEPEYTPPPPPAPVNTTAVQAATVPAQSDLLDCGETISTDGRGINPDVAVSRLVDADKSLASQCDPFPYELKSTPNGLRFIKPTGYPLAQFFVDVTWYRPLGDQDKRYSVDFEAVEGGYPVDMADCPSSIRDPETGEVVGLTDAKDLSPAEFAALDIVDQDGLPRADDPTDNGLTQFACIADTTEQFDPWADGGPRWKVFQRIWLLGDVRMRSY